jgi:DNA-binding transcriptional ArsR family regulator
MAYDKVLNALADATRRGILETLRARPMAVGEVARYQPVSRPAVSQHLRVLESARLVRAEERGTRRIYSVEREGLEELRRYLEDLWSDVLSAYGAEIARRARTEGES